jgi:GNAT superfamily N-acetyltransferase
MTDSTLIIRQADLAAQEVASDLLRRYFTEEGIALAAGLPMAGLTALLDDSRAAVLLATHTGAGAEVAGIATVTWTASAAHRRLAEVAELYVRPAARRRGVATSLLEAAIAWARDHGCTVCRLAVGPDGELSHGVAGFFTARGFDDDYRKVLVREVRGAGRRTASPLAGSGADAGEAAS